MTQTAVSAQQPCATCNDRGTVQVTLQNTATGKWETITQTCLDCQA